MNLKTQCFGQFDAFSQKGINIKRIYLKKAASVFVKINETGKQNKGDQKAETKACEHSALFDGDRLFSLNGKSHCRFRAVQFPLAGRGASVEQLLPFPAFHSVILVLHSDGVNKLKLLIRIDMIHKNLRKTNFFIKYALHDHSMQCNGCRLYDFIKKTAIASGVTGGADLLYFGEQRVFVTVGG